MYVLYLLFGVTSSLASDTVGLIWQICFYIRFEEKNSHGWKESDKIQHLCSHKNQHHFVVIYLFTNMQGSDHCDFLRKHNNQQNVYKGKHLTSYIGVVTDMFIRGRLLELDGCIWLLLIHQPLSQVHGLRVGATVRSIKHFFFYNQCLLLCILCKDVLG